MRTEIIVHPTRETQFGRTMIVLAAAAVLGFPLCGCSSNVQPPTTNPHVGLTQIAEGLVAPVGMEVPPDESGRIFLLDQVGTIRIVGSDGQLKPNAFLDLTSKLPVLNPGYDERGLLGLAFHPAYATNGRFFVRYSTPRAGDPTEECNDPQGFIVGCHSEVLAEYKVSADDPDRADAESETVLLSVDKPQFNHNGGKIAFGPDGFLYIGLGDGGGANDNQQGHTPELGNAQDKTKILGKILRIDVDSGESYGIPSDNPFVNEDNARPEIWALGLRNPWRFSFDASGQHRLFLGDAGQDLFEEVDIIERGGNYGWNIKEGLHCFDPDAPGTPPATCASTAADDSPLINPIIEYAHTDSQGDPFGIAVVGGYVYRGSAIPALQGSFVFGDYSRGFDAPNGTLFAASENAGGAWNKVELIIADKVGGRLGQYVLAFGQDDDGEVYVLTSETGAPRGTTGKVFKIVPTQ